MKKRDFIFIAIVLAVILLTFLILPLFKKEGAYVIVRIEGTEIGRYSLTENGEYVLNGGTHILRIEDGAAYMVSADCPDHLCVNDGKIDQTGEVITCLPYYLTVTVYGAEQADVELVS